MTKKKASSFIEYELDWLEKKANDLKAYIDARPFEKLTDRIHFKETKNGGVMPMISATIEAQRADLGKAIKEYADIIKVIDELREKEAAKQEKRGGGYAPSIMDED